MELGFRELSQRAGWADKTGKMSVSVLSLASSAPLRYSVTVTPVTPAPFSPQLSVVAACQRKSIFRDLLKNHTHTKLLSLIY